MGELWRDGGSILAKPHDFHLAMLDRHRRGVEFHSAAAAEVCELEPADPAQLHSRGVFIRRLRSVQGHKEDNHV